MNDQSWFWTPEWQAGERAADADIAAGRVETFASVDELLAWLARGEDMTDIPQGSPVPPPDEPVVTPDLTEPEDEGEVDNGQDTEEETA